jgi:hypothetical protein
MACGQQPSSSGGSGSQTQAAAQQDITKLQQLLQGSDPLLTRALQLPVQPDVVEAFAAQAKEWTPGQQLSALEDALVMAATVAEGSPQSLAATTATSAALIDCCVRAAPFEAVDVIAASRLLMMVTGAAVASADSAVLAGSAVGAAAIKALASALASLCKRTAAFTTAAGAAHAQGAPMPQRQSVQLAAHCAPAVAPFMTNTCFGDIAAKLLEACTVRWQHSSSSISSNSRGSSSAAEQQQVKASVALMAVLLARALVQLDDAHHAAAVAAGTTPAQLYAR